MTSSCPGCEHERVQVFDVAGMDCAAETTVVERALKSVPGVCSVRTSAVTGQATVVHTLAAAEIVRAIASTGFRAREARHAERRAASPAWTTWAALAGGLLGLWCTWQWPLGADGAFVLAVLVGGAPIARKGVLAIRHRALDMNALMTVAVVGAGILGEWGEAASTVVLFSLAQLLESRALDRARRAISGLMRLAPDEALVRRHEGSVRVPVEAVVAGEHVLVGPGQRVPLDGVVSAGESELDQSPLTGESAPVHRRPGDEVFAGSINGPGALDVVVTRRAAETTLSRIIRRVEEAQASRAPSQGFVERFARAYTPLVLAVAVLIAVVPPVLAGGGFREWLYRALVLLVVACPCALVISTPVSIVSALTAASRRGILIKGGAHLEAMARVQGIVFDKTGTLSRGVPVVAEVFAVPGTTESEVIALAAAVEARNGHAIGKAVVEFAASRSAVPVPAREVVALPGRGVRGLVDGRVVRVGSHRWFDEEGLCDHRLDAALTRLEEGGRTAMLVAVEGRGLVGYIGVEDDVRAEAAAAVRVLRADGLHVALLTGDNARTTRAVADRVGIEDRRAELLPDDKVAAVRELQRTRGPMAMVGDGVNDAPALAAAAVGIAVGTRASDATLETADIVLLQPDLRLVPATVRLGRAAARIVRQNVSVSIGVKAVVLVLTLAGLGTLWAAVAADMGASLLVIANGLRLLGSGRSFVVGEAPMTNDGPDPSS
jgi:Zn2+/Cd2+-exporting ATPase